MVITMRLVVIQYKRFKPGFLQSSFCVIIGRLLMKDFTSFFVALNSFL